MKKKSKKARGNAKKSSSKQPKQTKLVMPGPAPRPYTPPPPSPPQSRKPNRWWFWGRILGGLFFVFYIISDLDGDVGPVWPTSPQISLVQQDPGSPFALPFTANNRSLLFGIIKAEPICWIFKVQTDYAIKDFGLSPLWEIQDIPANNERTFYCGINSVPGTVSSAKIKISLDYDEDVFGILWHRRVTGDVFEWVQTTQGGVWIDDGYFPPDPKRPKGTIWNP